MTLTLFFSYKIVKTTIQISSKAVFNYYVKVKSHQTPKESYRTRQSKNNSSRCSSFGNKGTIDSPSDSDEFGEDVIYSHESPKMDEIIKDFDWESSRFVEYKSPFTRKETLPLGNNSCHRNIYIIP